MLTTQTSGSSEAASAGANFPVRSASSEFAAVARELALAAGFDLSGVAPVPQPGSAEDYAELGLVEEWINAGHAGEMEYLKRRDEQGRLLRSSLRVALPWARSVVVCALNYNSAAPLSIADAPSGTGWIARYAQSSRQEADGAYPTDYHHVLLRKLQQVEQGLRDRLQATGGVEDAQFESRCYVDTGPVVERIYAKYAGIGWTGKNTCILNQQLGSWMFLGVIVTSLELPADHAVNIAADRCGSCTRCIDACPTDAIIAPHLLDANRCIAYLTIEKKGIIAEELRAPMGRHVFGCDICQDVCPWNRRAPISTSEELQPREQLVNPALDWLAALDNAAFKRLFKGSPVERTQLKRLRRNTAIAMGNSGNPDFLPQLRIWATGDDAVLAETARWASDRLRSKLQGVPE